MNIKDCPLTPSNFHIVAKVLDTVITQEKDFNHILIEKDGVKLYLLAGTMLLRIDDLNNFNRKFLETIQFQ